ncbi:MAG: ATP-binding protein [Rudaea sp.]
MSEIRKLRSPNLWQTIFAAANDAMLLVDNRYQVRACNPRAVELYGYSEDELVGMDLHALRSPETRSELESQLREAREKGGLVFETEHMRRDGTRIAVEVSTRPLKLGTRPGWVDVVRDISERKAAERERERLLASERRARAAAEEAQDRMSYLTEASAILASSLDLETTLSQVTRLAVPRVADWCSIDLREEGNRLRLVEVAHVDPEKVRRARELRQRYPPDPASAIGVHNVIRTGKHEFYPDVPDSVLAASARNEEQLQIMREVGFTSVMIVPLIARGSEAAGALTFVSAESGRHFTPADLALAEELARHAAFAIENARLYEQSQEAVRARDMFLSVASHELKTPLTIIQGYAELLKRQVDAAAIGEDKSKEANQETVTLDRAHLLRRVDNVYTATARMTRLINELLDVNRMQRGALELNLEPVNLSALLSSVIQNAAARDQVSDHPRAVRIVADCPPDDVWGVWDRSRMEEVFVNLLDNAVKYSSEGGTVELVLRVERDQAGGEQVHLTVIDHGIGIPGDQLPLMFQPFMRASNAAAPRYPGLGLGLAISKDIVERHGGRIAVHSDGPGHGTTFHVVLPGIIEAPVHAEGPA